MAPDLDTDARIDARYHVQVELIHRYTNENLDTLDYQKQIIPGLVVNIFRGDNKLGVGDEIRFSVNICLKNAMLQIGDCATYLIKEDLDEASYLELFLDEVPPKYSICRYTVPWSQYFITDAPTANPVIDVPDKRAYPPRIQFPSDKKPPMSPQRQSSRKEPTIDAR